MREKIKINAKTILVYKTWETGENLEENVHVGDVRGGVNHCKWRGLTKDIPTASIVQCRWEAAEGIKGDPVPEVTRELAETKMEV